MMSRSACTTGTNTVVVSSAVTPATVAVFVRTAPFCAVAFTCALRVRCLVVPAPIERPLHVTVPPEMTPPSEAETKFTSAGSASVTVTFVAFTAEVFVTAMVYVSISFGCAVWRLSVFVMENVGFGHVSCDATWLALFDPLGSVLLSAVTLAVFSSACGVHRPVGATVALKRMVAAEPAFIVGLEQTRWLGSLNCRQQLKPSVCRKSTLK